LNSVIGFSDLLLTGQVEGAALSATQRDYLETISRNGRHLLQLINELLDLSKIAAGRMELRLERVTLDTLFREAADNVRAQLEARRHKLAIEPALEPLTVTADRGRLLQVLLNLLSNAIKFTTDGGRVTLSARLGDGGRQVRVAVSDTGIGIALQDQAKLFREFVQPDATASACSPTCERSRATIPGRWSPSRRMRCPGTGKRRWRRGSRAISRSRSTSAALAMKSDATSARAARLPQVDRAVYGRDAHLPPAGAERALEMLPELPGHDERIVGLDRAVHRARLDVRVQL